MLKTECGMSALAEQLGHLGMMNTWLSEALSPRYRGAL